MMKLDAQLPEMQELAEQIGEFIHYWGFKRVHGRIWTHLFLAKEPLDAAELVRQMKISKALVSISVRELMEYDVVLECGKSDKGTQTYKVNPDVLQVILNVLRGREKRMLSRIEAAHDALERVPSQSKDDGALSQDRLQQLRTLITDASGALDGLIALKAVDFAQWKDSFSIEDVLKCAGAGSGSPVLSMPAQQVSSSRSDDEVIQLIGRPLDPKS